MKELIQYCSERTGIEEDKAEAVVQAFLDGIVNQLSKGETVDSGDSFSVFTAQLSTGVIYEKPESQPVSRLF